jgi:hypothetical protein
MGVGRAGRAWTLTTTSIGEGRHQLSGRRESAGRPSVSGNIRFMRIAAAFAECCFARSFTIRPSFSAFVQSG